jgi:hypothetical protein
MMVIVGWLIFGTLALGFIMVHMWSSCPDTKVDRIQVVAFWPGFAIAAFSVDATQVNAMLCKEAAS